jgi:Flp pilus assembly protein TadD
MRRLDLRISRGEDEKALEEAHARVAKEPNSAEAHFLLGRVLGGVGKVEEARVEFQTALDFDPKFGQAWGGMALYHFTKKEWDKALREADRAHELSPSRELRELKAEILFGKGDRAGAYKIVVDSLQEDPADIRMRLLYAQVLESDGRVADAEKEYRALVAAEPTFFNARLRLVEILWRRGDKASRDRAIEECRAGLRAVPKSMRIRQLLVSLLIRREEFALAADVMDGMLGLDLPAADKKTIQFEIRRLRREAELPRKPKTPTADEVLKKIDSESVEERREVLQFLCEQENLAPYEVPHAAYRRIKDEDELVRRYATRLWLRIQRPDVIEVLDEILFGGQRESSTATRFEVVEALGHIGSPAALPTLVLALNEEDPDTVRAAIEGIALVAGKCFVDDRTATPAAADLKAIRERYARWWLEEPAGRFQRRKAAAAIATHDLRFMAPYVVLWITDGDEELRKAVLDCIARLTGNAEWRDEDTSTPEAREALKTRLTEAIGERK